MWVTTLLAILLLVAVIGFLVFLKGTSSDARATGALVSLVAGVIFAITFVFSTFVIVPTRDIGIVTQFGQPKRELSNGLHFTWPWQSVTNMDGAIQLQSFDGNSFDDPQSAVGVRLANNSKAFVEENLNWRIKPDAAGSLYQNYRDFDNIKTNLVDRQAQVALSKVFANFNPQITNPVTAISTPAPSQGADLPSLAQEVKKDLQDAVGNDIEILDVRIPGIFYDKATQDRIDAFNQKVQETKNAQQDVQTAQQQKLASEQRAQQAPPDLKIAIFNCINDQVKNGKDPAGCWGQPGNSNGQGLILQLPAKP